VKIVPMLKVLVIAIFGLLLALAPVTGGQGRAMDPDHCKGQMAPAATAASAQECGDHASHHPAPKPCTDGRLCSTMGCIAWASADALPVLLLPHGPDFVLPAFRPVEGVQAVPPFKPPRAVSRLS